LQFRLGPSEFLIGVSGSIGTFNSQLNVITSLTFVTNARSYGPFGKGRRTSFHIPMQGNGCIVGFFGRSGRYLNAIGVYTNPELKLIRKEEILIYYSILILVEICLLVAWFVRSNFLLNRFFLIAG